MDKIKHLFKNIKDIFKSISGTQATICCICFLVTLLITVQVRTISVTESDVLRLKKEDELRNEINQWKEVYEVATNKISELNKKIEEYREASAKTDDTVALIKNELDTSNLLAGLSDVKGEGIVVTLDDTAAIQEINEASGYVNSNVFIIHDTDILSIINELAIAGAEAFSVNGQRIISTSSIRCVGPVIQVNGITVSSPFVISAIGKPDTLASSLKLRGGIVSELKSAKIDVTIEKKDEITISAYDQVLKYKYAKPAGKGG